MKITLLSILLLASCVTTPQFTTQQRRALQLKTFEYSYNNVFRSIKNILQDDGYIITNQDFAGGHILATKAVDNSGSAALNTLFFGHGNWKTGTVFQISFNIEKIRKDVIETRLTIMEQSKQQLGGSSGREVVDPKIYKSIYNQLNIELRRRAARGSN